MVEEFLVQFQPNFFHGVGPRSIGGEWHQLDPRTILGEVIQDVRMNMDEPVVQDQKNPFSRRIVLIHKAEEAGHFLNWIRPSLPTNELPGVHIQAARNAIDRIVTGSLLHLDRCALASTGPTPVYHCTAILRQFLFIQEDIPLWISSVELMERADRGHLFVGE